MRDEDLERIERGDPSGPGEAIAAVVFLLAIGTLLAFIIVGALS